MDDLELAALLCSRLCHDLVSPVGAITNGLEILEDDDDPEIRAQAISHIGQSAGAASARLQFLRVAFGSGSSLGETVDTIELEDLAEALFARTRVHTVWSLDRPSVPKDSARLLLNLLLVAADTLPRGGTVTIAEQTDALVISAVGEGARMLPEVDGFLSGEVNGTQPDPRSVVAFYAGRLAARAGLPFRWAPAAGRVDFVIG
ncbi:histidine phosphotransferase family protein [Futiania mangrovi]|uniref:Histidine phosphotransferase family protein n=1 Tax=Futiania mangrovi TaxID=2959716 RepID=A0A9J6PB56_9PROT|nr:histidine phosphotransferase family protein [Futiania mangrovii]MCP1334912.1 histidine phosphotransferase family protein [Futiania mangrovii]